MNLLKQDFTKQSMSFVEYAVFSYPEGLEGWRCYRIEYGGHAQECIRECVIWLPPQVDVSKLEDIFDEAQGLPKKVWITGTL